MTSQPNGYPAVPKLSVVIASHNAAAVAGRWSLVQGLRRLRARLDEKARLMLCPGRLPLLGALSLALAAASPQGPALGQPGLAPDSNAAIRVVVDPAGTYQTIMGFGSSQRTWKDPHVANVHELTPDIPESAQEAILADLYSTLGLTRLRTHGVGFNTEPVKGVMRFDCAPGDGCAVDDRIGYVKQAFRYGLRTVLSENNPMRWMSGADSEEYVENTLALLQHWRAMGVEPQYQILVNEPSARDKRAFGAAWHLSVARALGPRMRAAGLRTMLVIPDDLNACSALPIAKAVLDDPIARRYVGAIAYHLYGGHPSCRENMKTLSQTHHVPVWMTSHYLEPGYRGALAWAKEIHELIAQDGVSAVDILWGFFGDWVIHKFNGEDLIQLTFDGSAHYLTHRRTPKYYIMGQFSRFVRPGDVRVGVLSPSDGPLVTAYRGDNRLVIVLINQSETTQAVEVFIRNAPAPRALSPVRTNRTEAARELPPIVRTGSGYRLALPGESVTTLVGIVGSQ